MARISFLPPCMFKNKSKCHRTTLFQCWTQYLPIWLLCSENEPKRGSWIGNIVYHCWFMRWYSRSFKGAQLFSLGRSWGEKLKQKRPHSATLGLMDRYPKIRQIIGNTKKSNNDVILFYLPHGIFSAGYLFGYWSIRARRKNLTSRFQLAIAHGRIYKL
jgi:hypothetical protein